MLEKMCDEMHFVYAKQQRGPSDALWSLVEAYPLYVRRAAYKSEARSSPFRGKCGRKQVRIPDLSCRVTLPSVRCISAYRL